VLPSSCSPSAASFAGSASPTGQRLASLSTTSVSVAQNVPASGRPPLATSQILALPILSNQVPAVAAGLRPPKPEMPAVNNGLAALFSAAMSAPTSHTITDARTLISCAPTTTNPDVNQTVVLLNPGVNPVHTLVGPAVRCINIPTNQNSPDVSVRANAMPMFMGLLANQQPTAGVQHRLLAVPLVNGSPASVGARLTAASLSSPRTVLTLEPMTTSPPSTCTTSVSTKLQQQPRYSANMTVKALLGGRTASSVDPVCNTAVKALLEGAETLVSKTNGTVTAVPVTSVAFGLTTCASESSSRLAVSGTMHPSSATTPSAAGQSASAANRISTVTSLGTSGASYILEAAASGLLSQSVQVPWSVALRSRAAALPT
jgi:hypothetical protein